MDLSKINPQMFSVPAPVFTAEKLKDKKVSILMSVPRLMFSDNVQCMINSLGAFGWKMNILQGVYFEQAMSQGIKQNLDSDYIITVDYDSTYEKRHVLALMEIIHNDDTIDAVVPIQIARHHNLPLCFNPEIDYTTPTTQIYGRGHFGLSVFRTSMFREIPKPWFLAIPNKDGEWADGKTDADIYFWRNLLEQKRKVIQANKVCIGHMELMNKCPAPDGVIVQHLRDFQTSGALPPDSRFRA